MNGIGAAFIKKGIVIMTLRKKRDITLKNIKLSTEEKFQWFLWFIK
jgi:hypothetical protein